MEVKSFSFRSHLIVETNRPKKWILCGPNHRRKEKEKPFQTEIVSLNWTYFRPLVTRDYTYVQCVRFHLRNLSLQVFGVEH